jgi:hypothetical protein
MSKAMTIIGQTKN